jgi:hypothetical protein
MKTANLLKAVEIAIAISLGYFLGRAAETWHPNPSRWIYDFQTLLAGGLAVLGAAWTVIQMNRTDDGAQKRHEELVKLQLRADRLMVLRACEGMDTGFRVLADQLDNLLIIFNAACMSRATIDTIARSMAIDSVEELNKLLVKISLLIRNERIESAKNLFEPPMFSRRARIDRDAQSVPPQQLQAMKDCFGEAEPFSPTTNNHDATMSSVLERVGRLPGECRSFADNLVFLVNEYDRLHLNLPSARSAAGRSRTD